MYAIRSYYAPDDTILGGEVKRHGAGLLAAEYLLLFDLIDPVEQGIDFVLG